MQDFIKRYLFKIYEEYVDCQEYCNRHKVSASELLAKWLADNSGKTEDDLWGEAEVWDEYAPENFDYSDYCGLEPGEDPSDCGY